MGSVRGGKAKGGGNGGSEYDWNTLYTCTKIE
jgi:hypothetical protein